MCRFVLVAGVLAGVLVARPMFGADHTTDSLDTVKKALADGKAVLVDVREDSEWADGHLKDARHLPLSALKAGVSADRLKEKIPPGKIVYIHCGSGIRSKTAADLLLKLGCDARALKDGYQALLTAGFDKAN
jgi:rhodanese-related sulfurtransferase